MRSLVLALRALRREWRSGELAVLWLSLSIAVAALSGVGFLVDRIGHAVELQASEVLAADLRVESDAADRPRRAGAGAALGLDERAPDHDAVGNLQRRCQPARQRARGERRLSAARASDGCRPAVCAPAWAAPTIPAPGEAWPDSRLAAALGAALGSELSVGSRALRVTRILISRPDQSSTFVEFASALLINDADLPATQLIQPGSRMRYVLLLAGNSAQLGSFRRWHQLHAPHRRARGGRRRSEPADRRCEPARGALPGARQPGGGAAVRGGDRDERAQLRAASSGCGGTDENPRRLAPPGAGGAICGRCCCWRWSRACSARRPAGSRSCGWCACCRGCCAADLPPARAWPALVGFVIALAMLAGFALPSLLQLTRMPALRVLRRDAVPPAVALVGAAAPVVLAIGGRGLRGARLACN